MYPLLAAGWLALNLLAPMPPHESVTPAAAEATAATRCVGAAPNVGDLCWQGRWWAVKSSAAPVGPGPNVFASDNISVQADGLHLTLRYQGGQWTSAEVFSESALGYGTFTWKVATPLNRLDPSVTLGLFTWNDDPAFNHREIDFEAAKWGVAADPTNAQLVVQPYSTPGNLKRIVMPGGSTKVSFVWKPTRVRFAAGGKTWAYTGADVPQPSAAVHMNLWLFDGHPPANGQPVEVVISGFTFTPA